MRLAQFTVLVPAVLVPAVLVSAGCFGSVEGSGKAGKRSVPVSADFRAVRADGAFRLVVRAGAETSLVAEGDDNLLELLTADVKDGTLALAASRPWSTNNPFVVTLTAPKIHGVAVAGAVSADVDVLAEPSGTGRSWLVAGGASSVAVGSARTKGLEVTTAGASVATVTQGACDKLVAKATGASKIQVTGVVGDATLTATGASSIDGKPLRAKTATVVVAGASGVDLDVDERLVADATGQSTVRYGGEPKVEGSVGKASKVEPR